MKTDDNNGKRQCWRPRFSLRTLAILVTLVCGYFGAWEATKRYGVPIATAQDVTIASAYSPAPFIVVQDEWVLSDVRYSAPRVMVKYKLTPITHVYFWIFGAARRIPVEMEWDIRAQPPADVRYPVLQ